MKRHYLLLILPLLSFSAGAQMLVGNAGGVQESGDVQLSYSVGETVTATLEGEVVLTQGFQQVGDVTTNIPEMPEEMGVVLYPNPCVDQLYFATDNPGRYDLEIYDSNGRTILHQQSDFSTLSMLNVEPLANGAYILRVRNLDSDQLETIHFQKVR